MQHRISLEYQQTLRDTHEADDAWGSTAGRWAGEIASLMLEVGARSVLDYGCGKGVLKQVLQADVREYDPGIPEKDVEPEPADMVVCIDVMEHVEPECVGAVLDHIKKLKRKGAFFVISTRKARKVLSDGRNAHLIQQGGAWWAKQFENRFDSYTLESNVGNDEVIVRVR